MADKYFYRQCFVASSLIIYSFSGGMTMAFPSVLFLFILSSTSDIRASNDDTSWLLSCNAITGLIGFFVLSPMLQQFGRKATHIAVNTILAIGWMTFLFATNITTLFIARLIHGLCFGAIHINAILVSEYTDSKRRGYFGAIKKLSVSLGVLFCHSMGLCWSWRQISVSGIFLALLVVTITLFWPESPSYLALKGRYEDCKKSFYWLNGNSMDKENELDILIANQTQRLERKNRQRNGVCNILRSLSDRNFLKTLLIATVLTLASDVSGKFYFFSYVIQIMKELVGDENRAIYCSLVAESVIAVALFGSCFSVHAFKRRTLVLTSGISSAILMLLISLIMYLKSSSDLNSYLTWITLTIVFLQNFLSNLGLIPVSYIIIGEIFALEDKGLGSCTSGISFMTFYFISLKLMPVIISEIGLQSMYLICGVCLLLCMLVLYFLLPETKDKTLQDIEVEMKDMKRSTREINAML